MGFKRSIKKYVKNSKSPKIDNNVERSSKSLSEEENKLIFQSHLDYRFGVYYLETFIKSKYNHTLSHNRIHNYQLSMNFACRVKRNVEENSTNIIIKDI